MNEYSTSRIDFLISENYYNKIQRNARSLIDKTAVPIILGVLFAVLSLNAHGQMADAFNPNIGDGATNGVWALQSQPDGKVLIGGAFTSVGGQTRNRLARLNADGTLDTTFADANLSQPVRAIALQSDGKILVGTVGTSTPTQALNQLFRFNADGTPDTSFNVNVNNGVYAISLQTDGRIIIGGFFTSVNAQARSFLARLNADGTLDSSLAASPDSTVSSLVRQPDGKILIGGIFSQISGSPRNRLARLNADGTLDASFNSLVSAYGSGRGIQTIAVQPDGKIIIGGYASQDGSLKIVARLNADGTPDTAFNQNVESFSGVDYQNVSAVALQSNGKILVGGGYPNTSLVRLNANGTTDAAFNPHPTSHPNPVTIVNALAVQPDQKILVGGYFTRIGGAARNNFARLLSDSRSVPATGFDFDGDNRADVSAFRPSNGAWYIYQSSLSQNLKTVAFGLASDRLAPADYDGDFKTDIAVFREGTTAYFYILESRTNTFRAEPFGTTGDVPQPADYDGDNKADVAVYRNGASGGAQSYFYYLSTAAAAGDNFRAIAWGIAGDKPVIGDYDGDGKQDVTVFRPSNGNWYISRSSDNQFSAFQFGISTDKLVAADYDGDFITDFGVYRSGTWYLQRSQLGFAAFQFGVETDLPIPADYDGDGKADYGVFRDGYWFLNCGLSCPGGAFSTVGDKPVPNAVIP